MNREHLRVLPADWWLRKRSYSFFMMRELTSLAVAAYAVFLLALVATAAGAGSFTRFFEWLRHPVSVGLHLVALSMVLFHTITWIKLMPESLVVWRGEERIPGRLIAAGGFAGWIVVSVLVAFLALR